MRIGCARIAASAGAVLIWSLVAVHPLAAAPPVAGMPAIAQQCRKDLAQRRGVPVSSVSVLEATRVTWPDASLGLPKAGRSYAQVLTPGWRLVLQAARSRYLYTASGRAFRYAGPLAAWSSSAVYIQPRPGEPNLNGDLMQVSLMGTHPVRLLSAVDGCLPQENGAILATRRTSRSGYELLLVPAGAEGEARPLCRAFAFGDAALSPKGDRWVAFVRPGVGAGWTIVWGSVDRPAEKRTSGPVPADARPGQLMWEGGSAYVLLREGGKDMPYEAAEDGAGLALRPLDFRASPFNHPILLNKSETLLARAVQVGGKPSTQVVREWFTGSRKVIATLPGFVTDDLDLAGGSLAFLSGKQGDAHAAYAVDLSTGEVLPVSADAPSAPKLMHAPPRGAAGLVTVHR